MKTKYTASGDTEKLSEYGEFRIYLLFLIYGILYPMLNSQIHLGTIWRKELKLYLFGYKKKSKFMWNYVYEWDLDGL